MELDVTGEYADDAYAILSSLIVPRPIAWVTTLNENGSVNLAPFSFFNMMGDDPPMLVFAPGNRNDGTPKDTAANCIRERECVVHCVMEHDVAAMVASSASLPVGESESSMLGLRTVPSTIVRVPRIATCAASMECIVHDVVEIGGNRMVIAMIKIVHIHDECFDREARKIKSETLLSVGRMATPDWYCYCNERFSLPRPR